MTESETIRYNREACERVLRRADRPLAGAMDTLIRMDLSDTPYPILEALIWAYRRIEELTK